MSLSGLNVLIVEDEPLIALDIAETLETAGACVAGPIRSLKSAFEALEACGAADTWDAVVLDYNLLDGTSEPFGKALKLRNIPFLIHTGNVEFLSGLAMHLNVPLVGKPATDAALTTAVVEAIRFSSCGATLEQG